MPPAMPLVLGLVIIVGFTALLAGSTSSRQPPRGRPRRSTNDTGGESVTELASRDPVEALRRYGTSDDAARLSQQGVDLGGLGYGGGDGAS